MKKLLGFLILVFTLSISSCSKYVADVFPMATKDGKIYYEGVIDQPSTSKDELYQRARRWFIDFYVSGKDVKQLEDPLNFEVVGRGYMKEYWRFHIDRKTQVSIFHKVTIEAKDNKYRYTVNDFYIQYYLPPSKYSSGSTIDEPLEGWMYRRGQAKTRKRFFSQLNHDIYSRLINTIYESMDTPVIDDSW